MTSHPTASVNPTVRASRRPGIFAGLLPAAVCVLSGVAAGGCTTVYKDPTTGTEAQVAPDPDRRVGHVYLIRGLFNVFSTGMGSAISKVREAKVDAHDVLWLTHGNITEAIVERHKVHGQEPIIIGGHSDGADNSVRVARELLKHDIEVDLVIFIDPYFPPPMPRNVKKVLTIYTRGLGLVDIAKPEGRFTEEPVVEKFNTSPINVPGVAQIVGQLHHFTIDKDAATHKKILEEVTAICPTRDVWATRVRNAVPAAPRPTGTSVPVNAPGMGAGTGGR